MLRWMLFRALDRFERTWSYDAGYLRQVAAVSPGSFVRFSLLAGMVPRAEPAEALAAATLAATLAEDCGPCVQIAADQARAAGVPPSALRAILAGDRAAMPPDAALAYAFACATLARDLEAADALRDQVRQRWGERGLVALGLAITAARLYPTLKYALGHGAACRRIAVGEGEPLVVVPR